MPTSFASKKDFTAALAGVLESWPLYRRFEYDGPSLYSYNHQGTEHGDLPDVISLYCQNCGAKQWWRIYEGRWNGGDVYFGRGAGFCTYRCKNCDQRAVYFSFFWFKTDNGGGLFYKIGQYPPLQDFFEIERQLEQNLDKNDLKLFRQALILPEFQFRNCCSFISAARRRACPKPTN